MSQFVVTGAPPLYVGVGGSITAKTPVFLGFAEGDVNIEIHGAFKPVFNSAWGATLPADQIFDGEFAIISFILNRQNEAVIERMMAQPNPFGTPGTITANEIGTVMRSEGRTYPFWVPAPYSTKAGYTSQRAGYRFLSCTMLAPKGVKFRAAEKPFQVILRADYLPTMNTGNTVGGISITGTPTRFTLYDSNMAGLPAPN